MTKEYVNGNLCVCGECLLDIKSKLKSKVEFPINNINSEPSDKSSDRELILGMLISKLIHKIDGWMEMPKCVKTKIMADLINHGQFMKDEIETIFEEYEYETTDYSDEFVQEHPEIDFIKMKIVNWGKKKDSNIPREKKYSFPTFGCDLLIAVGYCKVDVETLVCPDCGLEIHNTPENCTGGYERDLACPKCVTERVDEFDTKGLVRKGNPPHHGHWTTQKPELVYTGTDYFSILHPFCKKSTREDGKGVMLVSGVWIDDCGRVVLSLECSFCGARNALKPFTKDGEISLLNESGAAWKRIESPLFELIEGGENEKVEFKSSMRWDYKKSIKNKDLEHEITRTISAFLNSSGGILLIGVDNDGNIMGIEKDFETLRKGRRNKDGFELLINDLVNGNLGKKYRKFVHVSFEVADGKHICFIEIDKSPEPVFLKSEGKPIFVVRSGNSSQAYDAEEQHSYIKTHWE
ncbi:MAG: ATP-binding protein [Methanosarcinales archaeon]|nr:ATP-binding protein [Methanosarcinales archaeon]